MPYTMEDFRRDYLEDRVEEATMQQRCDLIEKLPHREFRTLLQTLTSGCSLQMLLSGRSAEEIETYLRIRKKK